MTQQLQNAGSLSRRKARTTRGHIIRLVGSTCPTDPERSLFGIITLCRITICDFYKVRQRPGQDETIACYLELDRIERSDTARATFCCDVCDEWRERHPSA